MVSFALPLTEFEIKVQRRHNEHLTHDDHGHPHDHEGSSSAVVWFSYVDEDDEIARALCPELSFVVERPSLADADEEMKMLLADYIEDFADPDPDHELPERPMSSSVQLIHMKRLAKTLELHPSDKGTMWQVGHSHVTHAQIPAQAT